MADDREEIRSRVDIVDLVRREIPLKQTGKHWTGLCPFHADKNPSFNVSSESGRFRCWSCQATGDIFDWVMRRQNVDFSEAIQILARQAGITLNRGGMPAVVRQNYDSAMEAALVFFRNELGKSSVAQDYCSGRGLSQEVLGQWQIGYAPDIGEALPTQLKRAGLSLSEAKTLFLVDEDAQGGYYSKFRRRLMFPIRDEKGKLVAFGGRLLGEGHPKYINSSDTPIYRKSRVLYGMDQAREAISKERQAVLVEGYLDVIACHQAGVKTAVASLGTASSEEHAKLLRRWCDQVVILYDSDTAGQKAAQRAVEILSAEGLRVRVALMPDGEDPDTLLRRAGPEAVRLSVGKGLSPTDYRMQALEKRLSPIENKEEFWQEAAEILASESRELEIVPHVDRLAGIYPGTRDVQFAKRAILSMIARTRKNLPGKQEPLGPRNPARVPVTNVIKSNLKSAEIVIFRAFIGLEFRRQAWMFARITNLFESGLARSISEAINRTFPATVPEGPMGDWLAKFQDAEVETALADLVYDTRADRLNEQFLIDSVKKLQEGLSRRKMRERVLAGAANKEREGEELRLIDTMLRQMKPDLTENSVAPDDIYESS